MGDYQISFKPNWMTRGVFACEVIWPKFAFDRLVCGSLKTVRLKIFEISVRNWSSTRSRIWVSLRTANDSARLAGPRSHPRYRDVLPKVKAEGTEKAAGLIQR